MTTVRRFDAPSRLDSRRDATGALRCDARIARVGVQAYRLADGTTSYELRPPEEVYSAEALASFEGVPVTLEHPAGGLVTSDSYRALARGAVSRVRKSEADAGWVSATLNIVDAEALAAVEAGKLQLSCGYTAERTPCVPAYEYTDETGTYRVDAVLSHIRGNHVALTDSARAGPGARLILDSADAVEIDPTEEYQVKFEELKAALDAVTAEREALKAELAASKAVNDSLTSEKANVEKVLAEARAAAEKAALEAIKATSPEALDALVLERAAVVAVADAAGVVHAGLTADAIRRAVMAKRAPSLKLDSFSAAQVADMLASLPMAEVKAEKTVEVKQSNPSPVVAALAERQARLGY